MRGVVMAAAGGLLPALIVAPTASGVPAGAGETAASGRRSSRSTHRGRDVQVVRTAGTFVRELVVAPGTRGNGSTWDVDLSRDATQQHLYAADGRGRSPGQFPWVPHVAVDSIGSLDTAEVDSGKRAQKFVLRPRGLS